MVQPALFDTTLRDGELSPRFRPSTAQRREIAHALDEAGVDVIELASSADREVRLVDSRQIAFDLERAVACCLSTLDEAALEVARRYFGNLKRSRIHLYLEASTIRALASDPALEERTHEAIGSIVRRARDHFAEVEFSPQDATRIDPAGLSSIVAVALKAGVSVINISDTTGTAAPADIQGLIAALRESVPGIERVVMSLHGHNHLGGAAENALAALQAGALQIEGTLRGVGPAGGNTDLLQVLQRCRQDPDLGRAFAHIDTGRLERIATQPLFQLANRD